MTPSSLATSSAALGRSAGAAALRAAGRGAQHARGTERGRRRWCAQSVALGCGVGSLWKETPFGQRDACRGRPARGAGHCFRTGIPRRPSAAPGVGNHPPSPPLLLSRVQLLPILDAGGVVDRRRSQHHLAQGAAAGGCAMRTGARLRGDEAGGLPQPFRQQQRRRNYLQRKYPRRPRRTTHGGGPLPAVLTCCTIRLRLPRYSGTGTCWRRLWRSGSAASFAPRKTVASSGAGRPCAGVYCGGGGRCRVEDRPAVSISPGRKTADGIKNNTTTCDGPARSPWGRSPRAPGAPSACCIRSSRGSRCQPARIEANSELWCSSFVGVREQKTATSASRAARVAVPTRAPCASTRPRAARPSRTRSPARAASGCRRTGQPEAAGSPYRRRRPGASAELGALSEGDAPVPEAAACGRACARGSAQGKVHSRWRLSREV